MRDQIGRTLSRSGSLTIGKAQGARADLPDTVSVLLLSQEWRKQLTFWPQRSHPEVQHARF